MVSDFVPLFHDIPESFSAPKAESGAAQRVSVLLPLPLKGAFGYLVPPSLCLKRGDVVCVPFGSRNLVGVVWGEDDSQTPVAKLKAIRFVLDTPPLPAPLCDFIDWVAAYTLQGVGSVLKMALSVPDALSPPSAQRGWRLADGQGDEKKTTPARDRVCMTLRARAETGVPPPTTADLAREASVGAGVISGLAKAGVIEAVLVSTSFPVPVPDPDHPGPSLSPPQAAAAAALRGAAQGGYSVSLLHGVTGSGKTEVYFEAVAETLRRGRQVLILLPEIALAARWPDRFARRFGVAPLSWHSQMTPGQRKRTWRAVASGQASVVIGARSALFLPFPDLGLIVVDEEHDASYKQDDGVPYHARDMAVVRGRLGEGAVVLASATPSLESLENVDRGRYAHLTLPVRHGSATLPPVHLVDLRSHPPGRWTGPDPVGEDTKGEVGFLSPPVIEATKTALEAGEQVLFYLNRRGYAPLTLCRKCGHRFACPNCSAWLVEHRSRSRLVCHHCGFSLPVPRACPECDTDGALAACGPGVERLAEEVAARFPQARTVLATSDTISGPAQAEDLARQIMDGAVDIVIGTQIMAKGHHFPMLTLVGVIDGDLGLSGGDPRAAERTFQLLSQVAGRAGREDRSGQVFIQTVCPDHPVMRALCESDPRAFIEAESDERRAIEMPPFGRLVALIVSGEDSGRARAVAESLGRCAPILPGIRVFGPAPAPLSMIRSRTRFRLLLKAARGIRVQGVVQDWIGRVQIPSNVRVQVDVDPVSFL